MSTRGEITTFAPASHGREAVDTRGDANATHGTWDMTARMHIRQATPEDAEALAEAQRATAAAQEGLLAARPDEISAGWFGERASGLRSHGLFVVLEDGGRAIGHLILEPLNLAATRHVVQLTLVVHPGHTGRGHGRRLMKHAIDWARRSPAVEKIELHVRSTNPRAIALYRSLGFTLEGTLERRIKLGEGYADDLCMALFVGEPRDHAPEPARP